ncbi:hypothetical protein OSTOST_22154, partial [Ostertagia ostertagi]
NGVDIYLNVVPFACNFFGGVAASVSRKPTQTPVRQSTAALSLRLKGPKEWVQHAHAGWAATRRLEQGRNFTPETKAVIANVMQFFGKLKEKLGERSRGTMFEKIDIITAKACGVSASTVYRVKNPMSRPMTPRGKPKERSRKAEIKTAMDSFGQEWGERLKRLVHGMLKEEKDITIRELRQQISITYPDFGLSVTTLWRLLKGLGFSFKLLKGQRFIFERSDLSLKRSLFLRKVNEARERGDCVVYMDETWVFEGMVKRKGWVDTKMSRFPSAETIRNYSCGKTAGKTKGKRGIVITALSEEGIVPGCTHVLLSGYRTTQDDYHREMDHVAFEQWLKGSIPLMKDFAAGKKCTLVLDNAPYHTRALYKLDDFVESRGGLAALRCYAAEKICSDLGVTLVRLPPFHCFFNPVEMCWSYLKHRLNKIGRPTDRLEIVRSRTLEILGSLPRQLCEGWCRETLREEEAARSKEVLDGGSHGGGG